MNSNARTITQWWPDREHIQWPDLGEWFWFCAEPDCMSYHCGVTGEPVDDPMTWFDANGEPREWEVS